MKFFVPVLAGLVATASAAPQLTVVPVGQGASTLVRAPAHDSASIESHRFGGNFAYATAEAHAFASVTPQISRATFPVAETTHTQEAPVIALVKKAPVVKTLHVASPVLENRPVFAQQPIVGPVAAHTTVEQPLQKIQTVQHHVSHPVHAYAHHGYGVAHPAHAYAGNFAYAQPGFGYAAQPAFAYAQPAEVVA